MPALMPPVARHALVWSHDQQCYTLIHLRQPVQHFRLDDNDAWCTWLAEHTRFAFHGRSGQLNVHQESRQRGAAYWYAYSFVGGRSRKRYLGHAATVTFARLEQVAHELIHVREPLPVPLV